MRGASTTESAGKFAGRGISALGAAFALCAALPAPGQEARVYYDTVENGQLIGGQLTIDLNDPIQRAQFDELPDNFRAVVWPVTKVRDNGPSANRIDLVIVGDGYTEGEMGKYAMHVTNLLDDFLAEEPFAAYASYFNVHRVDVVSAESGVDEIDEGIFKNTALDMAFGCFGVSRGLCVNVSKALAAAASATQVEQTLAMANSNRYGGAGYTNSNLGTVPGNNSSAVEIGLHEFGHSFADLADEYTFGATGPYTGEEFAAANVTLFTSQILTASNWKWFRWLNLENVDTFEGGATYGEDVYRPTLNSKMRSLGRPYEEVNVEQFVMAIYEIVSPIDDATPASAVPLSPCTEFFVEPVVPVDHQPQVQWRVNGAPVIGQVFFTFRPPGQLLHPGINTVSVRVADMTPRVRDESFRYTNMTFLRTWMVESMGVSYECECGACGDLSGDGAIDLRDAADFAVCFGQTTLDYPPCLCADLNGDLQVDLADLRSLIEFLGNPPVDEYPDCVAP